MSSTRTSSVTAAPINRIIFIETSVSLALYAIVAQGGVPLKAAQDENRRKSARLLDVQRLLCPMNAWFFTSGAFLVRRARPDHHHFA